MLPALERCSIILSRFSGIAKFQGSNDSVGFSSHQISLIMDTVACLHLVSSRILNQVVEELDLFASFSAWMRYEIDRLASDTSSSSPNEEMAEKEASIDHSKLLLYLQRIMTRSPLAVFFDDVSSENRNNDSAHAEEGIPMFALLHSQLQKQEQGLPYMRHLPQVHFLYQNLAQQANVVFGQIAEAEKRNVLFGKAIELGNIRSGALDMKISPIVRNLCWICDVSPLITV
jgi:anaphase-promoting complex subunit 4